MLDTGKALQAAGDEGQQAHQTALEHQQVQAVSGALMHADAFEMSLIFEPQVDVLHELHTANLLDAETNH